MAEGGQQTVYNIHIYNAQNQRDIVQTRTEIAAGEIGQINIPQAAEQQNVGQHQAADNVQPDNIAEGVDALNLSPKNTEASETGAIKKKDDRKVQDIPRESAKDKTAQQKHKSLQSPYTAEGGNKPLKISMLRSRATALIGQTKFDKAATLLEELAQLQKCTELESALMMVECYLQLGREKKGEKAIDDVRRAIMTSSVDADDVKTLAIDMISNSAYIRAILLLQIASDIYRDRTRSPDDVINGIQLCVGKINIATEPLMKAGGRSKIIGVDYGIEYMTKMLDDVRAIENADPVNKAIQEARCSNYIGYNYLLAKENEKSIKLFMNGQEVFEKQFGSNASKYIYGLLLHNIGVGYYNLGEYAKAESYYIKAIDAREKASDFKNEAEKQKYIELSKTQLKRTRAQLT